MQDRNSIDVIYGFTFTLFRLKLLTSGFDATMMDRKLELYYNLCED